MDYFTVVLLQVKLKNSGKLHRKLFHTEKHHDDITSLFVDDMIKDA